MRTKKMFQFMLVLMLVASVAVFARGPKREGPPDGMMNDAPREMMNDGSHLMVGRLPGLRIQFLDILLNDPEVQEELKLSKGTLTKIQDVITENKKFNIKNRADKEILQIDLQKEMDQDTIDETKVKELATKISALNSEIFIRNTTDNAKGLNLLSPDQKNKLKKIAADKRKKLKKRFKKNRKKSRKNKRK